MVVCAALAAGGGLIAWSTIRRQLLAPAEPHYSCAAAGTPLRSSTSA